MAVFRFCDMPKSKSASVGLMILSLELSFSYFCESILDRVGFGF